MRSTYDLIVVGAGSAGLSAATFAQRLGARVSLIDRNKPGGDCLWSGCVPTKTLIRAAKVAWEARHAERWGLAPSDPAVDLARVNAHARETILQVYENDRPEALRDRGIAFSPGEARFTGPNTIQVGDQELRGGKLLICTGARPARPPLPGLGEVEHLTYESILDLTALPERFIVLGAGAVGVELAQVYGRFGSRVTIVGRSSQVLRHADPAIREEVAEILRGDGIDLRLGAPIRRIGRADLGVVVETDRETIQGDALLAALGRVPNVEGLDLKKAGVSVSGRGIVVNANLRTSNPDVYACGDVVGGPQHTHYAGWQGYIAVRNALLPGGTPGVLAHVPWAVFTDPEVASVGLTEPEARERYGKKVAACTLPLAAVDRARTDAATRGFVKVLVGENGLIVGAHVVAPRAGEMIEEYILAMDQRIPFDRLAKSIHVYPTYASGNQQIESAYTVSRLLSGWEGWILRRLVKKVHPPNHSARSTT